MPTILITGSNRGLGLEFTRQYAAAGWRVHACCRTPEAATELADVAARTGDAVSVHALDIGDHAQIDDVARSLDGEAIDVLLNNAGIYRSRDQGLEGLDYDAWRESMWVNAFSPIRVTASFVDHVARSDRKMIASISSRMGSIGENDGGGSYLYRTSKAALNAANKCLSIDLEKRGVTAVVQPGGMPQSHGPWHHGH